MNAIHYTLIGLAAVFILLLPFSRKVAVTYLRLTVLVLVGGTMIVPFIWLICSAFKHSDALMRFTFLPPAHSWFSATIDDGKTLHPTSAPPEGVAAAELREQPPTLSLGNFRTLFTEEQTVQGPVSFWRYIGNSLFLASAGTFISLLFSSMGGYALAKYSFPGRGALVTFMLASLTIPGLVLLAPNFEVIWRLGWMDTYKALLIPASVSVFGIFLFRQAIVSIPDDLIEAGRIDGCGEFRIYLTLIMPLVRPMIGAYILISFLGAWNAFIGPNIFLQTQGKLTLPVVLNQFITQYRQQYGVFLAGTLLAIIPPAALFLALQREFISGLTSGALKQ